MQNAFSLSIKDKLQIHQNDKWSPRSPGVICKWLFKAFLQISVFNAPMVKLQYLHILSLHGGCLNSLPCRQLSIILIRFTHLISSVGHGICKKTHAQLASTVRISTLLHTKCHRLCFTHNMIIMCVVCVCVLLESDKSILTHHHDRDVPRLSSTIIVDRISRNHTLKLHALETAMSVPWIGYRYS